MSMFPGAGARVFRNEAGEPVGWDYPAEDEYLDDDEFLEGAWHDDFTDDDEEEDG